ncbi:MAG: class I SAM-dependent methyltransferase [Magnetovibrio sp.]|nr:class I SAM-dependent methyltransferase [Magnetovibrio sp.]
MAAAAKKSLMGKVSGLFGGTQSKPKPKPRKKLTTEELSKHMPDPDAGKIWPAKRLNVVEKLWGEGYVTPGGAEQVIKMLPLLELDSKKSALVLGTGLGGINETIVDQTATWITSLECDPELAEISGNAMRQAGLKKQAPVHHSTMEEMKLKPKSFDRILSFEGTLAVVDKKAMFVALCDSLRVDGELMYTTLVLPDTNPPNPAVQAWIDSEPPGATPQLWPAQVQIALLQNLNMDVRPVQDITQEYKKWVISGFIRFIGSLSKAEMLKISGELISELEYWTKRVTAIDSGGLKVCRFHAIRMADKRRRVV